jgi:hypothetical protein
MRKFIVLMLLAMVSSSAAAEWRKIGKSADDGFDYYADPATVSKKGNIVKMWVIYDYKAPQAVYGHRYLSSKLQIDYDCKGNRLRILHSTLHSDNMGKGNAVTSVNTPAPEWEFISSGNGDEVLRKFACGT